MASIAGAPCQLKKGLFSCGSVSSGVCQYCGRPFCERHGLVQADGQEICSRKFCIAKRDDLLVHLAYKTAVLGRNAEQRCGLAGCDARLATQCVRCKGYFCERHAGPRDETVMENQVRVARMANLCRHCADRRPIWLRM